MFKLMYNGKIIETDSRKNFSCLQRAVKMADWMAERDATINAAADNFGCADNTVRRSLKMLGVKIVKRNFITQPIVTEGIKLHLKTGSSDAVADRHSVSRGALHRSMREANYRLRARCFVEPKKKIDIQSILCAPLVA